MKKGMIIIMTALTISLTYAQEGMERTKFDGTWKITVQSIDKDDDQESFFCLVKQGKVYPLKVAEDR